jgi:uncharacterized protein YfaS (alpha-2-macroglobulin family)
MAKNKDIESNKPAVTKPATVKKIIESPGPEMPEKAEISIDGCEPLYQELRIENKLTDEKGNEVKLKQDAHIDVTVVADPKDTTPKR